MENIKFCKFCGNEIGINNWNNFCNKSCCSKYYTKGRKCTWADKIVKIRKEKGNYKKTYAMIEKRRLTIEKNPEKYLLGLKKHKETLNNKQWWDKIGNEMRRKRKETFLKNPYIQKNINQKLKNFYKNNPNIKKEQTSKAVQTIKNNPITYEKIKKTLYTSRMKTVIPKKDSKIEIKIQNFLKQLKIEYFTHQYMKIEHGYQCDILIPSLNLVIECDGNYWHKYPIGRDIDDMRTNELIEKGFKVLRLWEVEINSLNIHNFKNKLEEIRNE